MIKGGAQDQMAHLGTGCAASAQIQEQFPISATIAGVAVVTIPLAEYAELLDCRRRVGIRREAAKRLAVPPRSPIENDADVASFLTERFGRMDMLSILSECRKRFGPQRTPSRTAAYDFWQRLRRQANGDV